MWANSYLLIPSCLDGNGTGHLRRIINLYKKLKKDSTVFVYVPIYKIPHLFEKMLKNNIDRNDLILKTLPEQKTWNYIVVDYMETPEDLVFSLKEKGFLIGIDEGGTSREEFDYLIDIIPSLEYSVKANYSSVGLMELPERRLYQNTSNFKKILITFGGEDNISLTKALLDFIKENNYFTSSKITVLGKNSFDISEYKNDIKFFDSIDNLKSVIYEYDLVFTSFGLTAFETLASGVPFLLLNPTIYHHKLSKKCNFVDIGIKKPDKNKLEQFLQIGQDFNALQEKYIPATYTALDNFIKKLNISSTSCPVCHHVGGSSNIISRFESRNFYNCPECGITYQVKIFPIRDSYRKEYFFDEYKNQYGCTYLEDFENIQSLAVPRLKILKKMKSKIINNRNNTFNLKLLDVGCAYGPFLVESKKYGFSPTGVEIISDAVNYVRRNLSLPILKGSFESVNIGHSFDVITMWYVIEHFSNLELILSRANKLLNIGGIFAFSTPNSSGISALKKKDEFLNNSPLDHITVWNPDITEGVLSRFGFKVKKIRITGHHPERFSSFPLFKTKLGYSIFVIISKIFGLGDTFEVYTEKMKELND